MASISIISTTLLWFKLPVITAHRKLEIKKAPNRGLSNAFEESRSPADLAVQQRSTTEHLLWLKGVEKENSHLSNARDLSAPGYGRDMLESIFGYHAIFLHPTPKHRIAYLGVDRYDRSLSSLPRDT
jgi:hypothetical protein